MYIVDEDGRKEEVHLDKITSRIQKFCYGLNMDFVDPVSARGRAPNLPSPSSSLSHRFLFFSASLFYLQFHCYYHSISQRRNFPGTRLFLLLSASLLPLLPLFINE